MKNSAPVPFPEPPNAPPADARQIGAALQMIGAGLTQLGVALSGGSIENLQLPITNLPSLPDPHAAAGDNGRQFSPLVAFPAIADRATVGEARTVREVFDSFIIAKAKVKKSDRYLRQCRYILASFAQGRSGRRITEMTAEDAEKWIYGLKLEPPTMKRHFAQLRTVLRWAIRKGWLAADFTLPVELPADLTSQAAPKITTPQDVRQLLNVAYGIDPDAGRHWAIRYFAGIRREELLQLREENIWLQKFCIEVPAHVAKTRRRRLVHIEPNLAAWLALGGELRAIDPDYLSEVRNFSGIVYTDNAPRKSFISYHVAMWENAARTALQAGTSEAMVFKNYNQGAVTKEMAREFWSIAPGEKIAKVRGFKRKPHAR